MPQLCRLFIVAVLTLLPLSAPAAPTEAPGKPYDARSLELNELGTAALKAGEMKRAEQMFRDALAADRSNLTAVYNLSGLYMADHREDVAISILRDYTEKYAKDPALFARLGDAYFSSKNLPEAQKNYQRAIDLDPDYPGLASKLATIYTLYNNYGKAEELLKRAAEKNPRDGQLLSNLSSIYLANGKARESIATAKLALQVKVSSDLYVTLGNAYEIMGDRENSLIAFERARDLGDKRAEITQKIADLKKAAS